MTMITDNDKEKLEKYRSFVENSSNGSFMQDVAWAKIKKNWEHFYVYIEENGEIVIGMTVLIQKIPKIQRSIMYSPRGPVGKIEDSELLKKLLQEIEPLVTEYKVFCFKTDPNVFFSDQVRESFKKAGFLSSPKSPKRQKIIQPVYHMVLSLKNKSREQVFESFLPKTRYNIRLAKKKGIDVTFSNTEEDLKTFYDLFLVTTKRNQFPGKSYDYFKELLNSFDSEHLRIYVARYCGQALAAAITLKYGEEVFYLYGASSNEMRNFMPTYLLQWEMIQWGIENNCSRYNFGGLASPDTTTGLYRFKEGFCHKEGMVEYTGEFTKVYDPFFYLLYDTIYPNLVKLNSIRLGLHIK